MFGFVRADSWELNRKVRALNTDDNTTEIEREISELAQRHNDLLQLVKTLSRAINSEQGY